MFEITLPQFRCGTFFNISRDEAHGLSYNKLKNITETLNESQITKKGSAEGYVLPPFKEGAK